MYPEKIISQFTQYLQSRNRAKSTVDWSRTNLNRFFSYLKENYVAGLDEVDADIILGYQQHLSVIRNCKGELYNARTQNYAISTVRDLFGYLMRRGMTASDPTDNIELAKTSRPLPRHILSVSDMSSLLSQPDIEAPIGLRDKAILELLYSTGIRRNECICLDVGDVDFADSTAMIREGKGGRDRIVPLTRQARAWLREYIRTGRIQLLADPADQALFLNKYGRRLGKQGLWTMLKRRARRAGMGKDITLHSIRHTTATHLADAGCDIRYIQEILGHSRTDTTAVYITVSGQMLKRAIHRYHPSGAKKREKRVDLRPKKRQKKRRKT